MSKIKGFTVHIGFEKAVTKKQIDTFCEKMLEHLENILVILPVSYLQEGKNVSKELEKTCKNCEWFVPMGREPNLGMCKEHVAGTRHKLTCNKFKQKKEETK